MASRSRVKRVGPEFDEFVKMMQRNLEPIVGRKPSYREVTNSLAGFIVDERAHERMIIKSRRWHRGRKPERYF